MMEWNPEVSWPELPDVLKLLLAVPERTTIDFSTQLGASPRKGIHKSDRPVHWEGHTALCKTDKTIKPP
jgi:hypothetical protein